ncbi:cytochrome c biogenesis protein CcsA [Sulfurimonas sp. C5]|uniref:cytochrome c biogenesis protein n=1 Tax=Sulfurimonas sp. C5 TaxID=3036947 RepID=UPI0024546A49|nr:cytochrome c biogenesis protein CcsA [Sulfurimonas sp. C5]MDH4943756.1 cytochrome c biogenesis protein CcsA [Sulfurimonas sp. C5]
MKQVLSLFSSMKTMAVLMLIFAFSIGYATIIENDFGTMTAKAEIYNARWFEVLLGLLAFNLFLNIINYRMFTAKKAPIFIFHIAFFVILFGAAITRYAGFEGTMHIREGLTMSSILSSEVYLDVTAKEKTDSASSEQKVFLSKRSTNNLGTQLTVNDKNVDVKLVEYIPDAIESIVADPNGKAMLTLMVTGGGQGQKVALAEGSYYDAGNFVLDFGSGSTFNKPVISIFMKDNALYMKHDMKLSYFKMADRSKGELVANANEVFNTRMLYSTDLGSFVLREFLPKAVKKIVSDPNAKAKMAGLDVLRFNVSVGDTSKEVLLYGRQGVEGVQEHVNLDGVDVSLRYGAKEIPVPLSITLKDFQLDRYPGSMSPASYASEVQVVDKENGVDMPYRIFMNHVLDYKGYRFFQASYDRDEKGTVLSVNHDPGTLPTYFGYFLLALGMFWSLFSKHNRFSKLAAKAKKAAECQVVPALLGVFLVLGVTNVKADVDPAIKTMLSFDKAHADKFGKLIVQDTQGRMKPLDTLATEVLAKVHRSAKLNVGSESLDPNQVIIGMMIRPDIYKDVKLIRTGDPKVNEILGAAKDAKYVSFAQFFHDPDNMRGYKLAEVVDEATRKAPKDRNKLDKKALEVDEKVNVVYMVFTGTLIKIWPKPQDENNKWLATIDAIETLAPQYTFIIKTLAFDYFTAIDKATQDGNWTDADKALEHIEKYQKDFGKAVYPSANSIKAEIFYNHANIFERLYPLYLIMGFILLILSFIKIVKPTFKMGIVAKGSLYLLVLFFIAHTIGLALRWYISGHAPWSNGYESMIYIGWATVLAGFIFSKRSPMTLASTSILTGLILFVAHLNWMNPQVTNLVPVLNSYWLSIHVSMITGSYGFLGLGALLGFITLLLFIFKTKANEKQISLSIKELNAINEMSLMIGLATLTVGNFLGGVWANESWGRYWGWDPKETWALVTILVYAVVVHLRFIKSIYNEFNYSVISLLAFTSVLMTYFGVNYYLAGMHSYAKGDPVPIPDFVPITYAIIFVVIALAFRNRKLA